MKQAWRWGSMLAVLLAGRMPARAAGEPEVAGRLQTITLNERPAAELKAGEPESNRYAFSVVVDTEPDLVLGIKPATEPEVAARQAAMMELLVQAFAANGTVVIRYTTEGMEKKLRPARADIVGVTVTRAAPGADGKPVRRIGDGTKKLR